MVIAKMEIYICVEEEKHIEEVVRELDEIADIEKDGYTLLTPGSEEFERAKRMFIPGGEYCGAKA